MKVLNLYSGIGGNRKLWKDVEVTAIECDPDTIDIYKYHFPDDEVILADAHLYLIENYDKYDMIWSSPPCPTHSRFNNLKNNIPESVKRYPDMQMYQEVIYLKHFFKTGPWVVENVISYYDPLVKPIESNNHYFWSNFDIPVFPKDNRDIRNRDLTYKAKRNGFNLDKFAVPKHKKRTLLNNCVLPELGEAILKNAKQWTPKK
tara:strand:+ start:84 stop:692 length:609 start_codon:yes stop_codon:yes gene_type:complete